MFKFSINTTLILFYLHLSLWPFSDIFLIYEHSTIAMYISLTSLPQISTNMYNRTLNFGCVLTKKHRDRESTILYFVYIYHFSTCHIKNWIVECKIHQFQFSIFFILFTYITSQLVFPLIHVEHLFHRTLI